MKKLCLIFVIVFLTIFTEKSFSQEEYSWMIGANISYLMWDNSELSDYYEGATLFGITAAKQISDDFKIEAFGNFGKDAGDDAKFEFSQLGGDIKYSWYAFGSEKPNVYSGFGASSITFEESADGETEKGSSLAFLVKIGVEIPLGELILLDIGWTSTWCDMKLYDETIKMGHMLFHGGLILKL
jgi:hypothetical protein